MFEKFSLHSVMLSYVDEITVFLQQMASVYQQLGPRFPSSTLADQLNESTGFD